MAVAVRPKLRLKAPALVTARGNYAAVHLLAGLVGLSFVLRATIGWLRATPVYFGDEYLYSSLGRSLAEHGRPLVRGHAADFPALLQPLLTAPVWLVDDVGVAYHLDQTLGALAISLAAVPVYWLARRLDLSAGVALALAVLALALPDLVYASWVVAEPFAYPLALAAIAAAVAALARPTRGAQLAFVALAALAAFARIQFVVLPACFLGAVVIVGLRERRVRAALREQLLPFALFAVPVAVALALGPSRVLAFYGGVVHVHLDPLALVGRSGRNLLVLLYDSGFVLVPGALLGLGLALARPRSRGELAFAAMTALLAVALLLEAGLFGAVEQAQERYLFYVLPLAAIGFALYAARGWPLRLYHALLAGCVVTVAAVVPLAGYAAADEKAHSPSLYGVFRIEQWLGTPGNGSIALALAGTLGVAAVVACSLRPGRASIVALSIAIAFAAGLGAATVIFDHDNSRSVRRAYLPRDPSWVDHAHLGDVTLLRNIAGVRGGAFQELFWNRSVTRLALMPGAPEIDPFNADRVHVADDGSIVAGGRPLTGALLVDEHAVTMEFSGARKVGSAPGYSLYRPDPTPRVSLFFLGRYDDGWLGDRGTIIVWPRPGSTSLHGTLVLELRSPVPLKAATVFFHLPGGRLLHTRVPAGGSATVRLPVCSRGPWATGFRSKMRGFLGDHSVSVKGGVPRFVAGGGCTAPPRPAPAHAGEAA